MTVQVIRKTTNEFEEENLIIPDDMLGVEKTESGVYRIKRGNGIDTWLDLPYFVPGYLSMEACSEFVGDYCVEKGSYIPVAGRFAMFDPGGGLKSGRAPAAEDDVVRLEELEGLGGDVSENIATLQGNINDVAGDLATEVTDRGNADTALQGNIDNEEDAREAADGILQGNLDTVAGDLATETTNRANADTALQDSISDIQLKIESLNGAYFVLPPFGFDKNLDAGDPDDILILNSYAISQTPGASGIADILDNTVIINLFDNCEYIYNKTSTEWLVYPNGFLAMAANNHLGVVKGTADPGDGSKDGAVSVNILGEMAVIGFTGLKTRVGAAEDKIDLKLDIQQDAANEGKVMVIGPDGILAPGVSGGMLEADGEAAAQELSEENPEATVWYPEGAA
jgi:hypothetical protein